MGKAGLTLSHKDKLPISRPGGPLHLRHAVDSAGWRATLATSVASAALMAYGAPTRARTTTPAIRSAASAARSSLAPATCRPACCFQRRRPLQVLNVHNLTANIAPASGVSGIEFTSNGSVELNVDPARSHRRHRCQRHICLLERRCRHHRRRRPILRPRAAAQSAFKARCSRRS